MEWQNLQSLYLIVPTCVAWGVLALYADRRRLQARKAFAATDMWSRILPEPSRPRFWVKLLLREVAIIAGLLALAGPRWGLQYEQVIPRGSDLYILIDVSRSMLADDVPPSRLGRAKIDVAALLNRLDGERVGLIAFAGQAVVKCPLTVDYDSFRRALEELDPDSAPRGGTAIGDAIRKAIEVFHAKSDRDQAILLITDGDDQESYPLEAAAIAAERHVTVFTVGLGDAQQGARIPQKANDKTFVEYEGEQVWSKLDGNLLQEIAVKTNGVYVPAGTKAYDLGELYVNHLQGRRSDDAATQQKIRKSERFQIFLGVALLALLIDLCIGTFRNTATQTTSSVDTTSSSKSSQSQRFRGKVASSASATGMLLAILHCGDVTCLALEPQAEVREGLKLYSKEKYEEAREKFGAAAEELEKQKSAAASIAAFDEACSSHRKGDLEKARDKYLTAGLSPDVSVATSAHFNLGTMSAEKARTLAGEKPEMVPADKRKEILDQLEQAIAAYRHCLELKPDHLQSRRNLELLRQWIKYYTEQWREQDRQKRRDETNLIQFLDFLIGGETALREVLKQTSETTSADAFAEFKRAQEELTEEIPTLREKIAKELRPPEDPNGQASKDDEKQIEEGITMLQGWADTAGQKMAAAARQLGARNPDKAVIEQKTALDELNKIWEAVIPFHPLLSKELSDQSAIAKALAPAVDTEAAEANPPEKTPSEKKKEGDEIDLGKVEEPKESESASPTPGQKTPKLELADTDLPQLEEQQLKTLNRALLLGPKAEDELKRLEKAPTASPDPAKDPDAKDDPSKPNQVDPEQVKDGYRKAIELAPQAVTEMEAALKAIHQKDRATAGQRAEEARRILEEIQKAQPKNDPQQNQNQENQNGDDQQQNEQKNEDQKSSEDQKPKDGQQDQKEQSRKQQQQQASQDRIEDALRKVREREKEKHERDKKNRGRFLGKTPVDKDW